MPDAVVDEMKIQYQVRSSRAAHSQSQSAKVTREEALKMKVFADVVIHHVFKKQGVELLRQTYA